MRGGVSPILRRCSTITPYWPACLELWQATKKARARYGCEATLSYLLRDMSDDLGGFYSAEDADSSGKEGMFLYVDTSRNFFTYWGKKPAMSSVIITMSQKRVNFDGRTVLFCKESLEEFSAKHQLDPVAFAEKLEIWNKKLFLVRERRPHPFKDDKILASWNGLTIYTLATAAAALMSRGIAKRRRGQRNLSKRICGKRGISSPLARRGGAISSRFR